MIFGPEVLHDLSRATHLEWLVTNGLGGFASSTIVGVNTRRYHGLLVAALDPPGDRVLLVSKVEVELVTEAGVFPLGTNKYLRVVHPEGYRYLFFFTDEPWPTYLWKVGGVSLRQELIMPWGENTTLLLFRLLPGSKPATLRLIPLVNCRNYHEITRENTWPFRQETWEKGTLVEAYSGAPRLRLSTSRGHYFLRGVWYREMEYEREKERGLSSVEDHFSPGYFEVDLEAGEEAVLRLALEEGRTTREPGLIVPAMVRPVMAAEHQRRRELLERAAPLLARVGEERPWLAEPVRRLVLAADAFLVQRRRTGRRTILAGYPWFTDWGRDAMISLPGLTLATGRPEVAREVLTTFAEHCWQGLIPNRFTDVRDEAEYNTIDASLWFVLASYRYLMATRDLIFVQETLWPVIRQIMTAYRSGTKWGIKATRWGLVTGGSRGVQLTWMDAKIGEWVVTPRHGMAVEVNALWYNALKIAALLGRRLGDPEAGTWETMAAQVQRSFREFFWNSATRSLFDVVTEEGGRDASVRPNQILAVSLPFSLLEPREEAGVVQMVARDLLTPYGLRSLSPRDPSYRGVYGGDQWARDAAYHQGTVWAWLMGPFLSAALKVYGTTPAQRELAWDLLVPLLGHVFQAGLGFISEIFDGNYPHLARGCIAQAWSVGEVLRVLWEDLLHLTPEASWLI